MHTRTIITPVVKIEFCCTEVSDLKNYLCNLTDKFKNNLHLGIFKKRINYSIKYIEIQQRYTDSFQNAIFESQIDFLKSLKNSIKNIYIVIEELPYDLNFREILFIEQTMRNLFADSGRNKI